MAGRRRKSAPPDPVSTSAADETSSDAAFEVWLNRGLHQLYDDVAREPIPDELLNIIETDRARIDQGRDGNAGQTANLAADTPGKPDSVPGSH